MEEEIKAEDVGSLDEVLKPTREEQIAAHKAAQEKRAEEQKKAAAAMNALYRDSVGKTVELIATGETGVIDSVDEYGVVIKILRPTNEWYDKKKLKLVE